MLYSFKIRQIHLSRDPRSCGKECEKCFWRQMIEQGDFERKEGAHPRDTFDAWLKG